MVEVDPGELMTLALQAAGEAAELTARGQRDVHVLGTKSTPTDVVTDMDRAAERLLRDRLLSARPDDAILGEEEGGSRGGSGVRWVLDPIDGTVNYLYGRQDWAVSVAAEVDGRVVAGVVHAPIRGEVYRAIADRGAFRNAERLQARQAPPLRRALLATGFGYAAHRRAHQAEVLRSVLPRVRDIRRAGASTLDVCGVASGEVDGYFERGLNQWDWAASALIAQEAGVTVGGLRGRSPNQDLTVAARGTLFDDLCALLEPLAADSDG